MKNEQSSPKPRETGYQTKPEPTEPQTPQQPQSEEIRTARLERSTLSSRTPLFRS